MVRHTACDESAPGGSQLGVSRHAGCLHLSRPDGSSADCARLASSSTPFLQALAWAVRTTRTAAQVPRHVIAVDAGVNPATVARFERGEAWPWNPEPIVSAVAERAHVDPAEIWQAAVHAYQGRR